MMKTAMTGLLAAALLASAPLSAQQVTVEVSNLTNGISFTPLLIVAHTDSTHLFELGETASPSLQAMAEGGDISELVEEVTAAGAAFVENPAGGILAPGAKTTVSATLDASSTNNRFSVVAMMLPTNDGFIGLDSQLIPTEVGTYTFYLNGYDAGTEANDEIVNGGGAAGTPGIPADPAGNAGTGGSGVAGPDHNTTVHVHRGVIGDTDPTGGTSDLDSRIHHWLNPVARVVITVQ